MVTAMGEQPGPKDPAERHGAERQGADRQVSGRPGSGRPRQQAPGADVFGDLQRWFIRQSAKNMRNQIGGQVRRTLGTGREASDVWDTATTEIPPEVGESPECQWCPICRAARRMRDSGPGIGGQLSGAGDVVATAVQDAISALDSLLSKASGPGTARDNAAAGGSRSGSAEDNPPAGATAAAGSSSRVDSASPDAGRGRPGLVGLPGGGGDSAGARSATDRKQDPWAAVSDTADASTDADADAQSNERGHEPDDRS
jgi:hypothetical protein